MKIFAVSDIHSYYDILRSSLKDAGFEENNPEHLLICCGDYWDRGLQPIEVMNYLMSLTNVVLIRGNHEDLMMQMLYRRNALGHDKSNGTYKTFFQLLTHIENETEDNTKNLYSLVEEYIQPFYNKMIDYYETSNYVFVHGWIPVHEDVNEYYMDAELSYKEDWRNASEEEWKKSRWYNGMDMAYKGIIIPDKTVVCGHWHCSYGWMRDAFHESVFDVEQLRKHPKWDPYKNTGIIAIDRCTAGTKEMNILVIEDDLVDNN